MCTVPTAEGKDPWVQCNSLVKRPASKEQSQTVST